MNVSDRGRALKKQMQKIWNEIQIETRDKDWVGKTFEYIQEWKIKTYWRKRSDTTRDKNEARVVNREEENLSEN